MKKIALLTTVLLASTAAMAGQLCNKSSVTETVTVNGKTATIKAGACAATNPSDQVSFKGSQAQAAGPDNWEIREGKLQSAKTGAGSAAAGSPAAAEKAATAPAAAAPAAAPKSSY